MTGEGNTAFSAFGIFLYIINDTAIDTAQSIKMKMADLMEMAKQAGRTDYTRNQLLRECYNLVDVELNTFEGWKEKGAQVRKGQHAYLFWGAPIEKGEQRFCPVRFLFAKEQVHLAE